MREVHTGRASDAGSPLRELDDRNYLNLALSDPQGFIDELPEYVTIDEIQRVPELTLAIKRSVDTNRKPGRFLLTGSTNLLQLPRLSDSLAGRIECLFLQPFTESEKAGYTGNFLKDWMNGRLDTRFTPSRKPNQSTLPARLVAGGYPEAFRRTPKRAIRLDRIACPHLALPGQRPDRGRLRAHFGE